MGMDGAVWGVEALGGRKASLRNIARAATRVRVASARFIKGVGPADGAAERVTLAEMEIQ
jgi:hypothetical protein